jgi:hypothetical protein
MADRGWTPEAIRKAAEVAATEEDARNRREESAAEAQRRAVVEQERGYVLKLVEQSLLASWFPGADWEVYETQSEHGSWFGPSGIIGVVCTGRPAGTDPGYAGVPCFGIAPPADSARDTMIGVFVVHEEFSEGYSYWQGPRVTSLAGLGRVLQAREQRARPGAQVTVDTGRPRTPRLPSASMMEAVAPGADELKRAAKTCPETGGRCQRPETCENDANVIDCWARHCRRANEPEGRTTGLHRDSMG